MPQDVMVSMRSVNKSFGRIKVLSDIDLDVSTGQVVAVIGPSGSGKSTLCRVLNQLESIDSGDLFVCGSNLPLEGRALTKFRSNVGMVFQNFALFPHMTVMNNITKAPITVKGLSKSEARQVARELLLSVGVLDQADKFPLMLSGGQQQRAAIARALAMKPRLMIFDEPTSALDPEMINEVLEVIRLVAQGGMTMVIVTHEMNFARKIADCIVFMDEGRIIEKATPQAFFTAPTTSRGQAFLESIRFGADL